MIHKIAIRCSMIHSCHLCFNIYIYCIQKNEIYNTLPYVLYNVPHNNHLHRLYHIIFIMCKKHICSCYPCSVYLTIKELIPHGGELIVIPGMEDCIFCSLVLGKLTPELVLAKITNSHCNKCELDDIIRQCTPKPPVVPAVRVQNAERFLRCSDCARGDICSPKCRCPPDCVCVVPKQCANHNKQRRPIGFT